MDAQVYGNPLITTEVTRVRMTNVDKVEGLRAPDGPPTGDFLPMLRLYWPQETNPSILDGSWTPPRIMKVA